MLHFQSLLADYVEAADHLLSYKLYILNKSVLITSYFLFLLALYSGQYGVFVLVTSVYSSFGRGEWGWWSITENTILLVIDFFIPTLSPVHTLSIYLIHLGFIVYHSVNVKCVMFSLFFVCLLSSLHIKPFLEKEKKNGIKSLIHSKE